ncbi:hypothetical protein QH639_18095 [Lysinibacillus sp. 1 U-2021]|uniref:hypothetical protein n=1 Tax=Lysinibacillus sp. 1 U-2021 TaxID=3039426 RepID=UPI00247FE9FD|nr:hypothetical protein [Lysinibacillus sp. 1 U-2021]WGT37731.1 hypothetical protein QH639_18095 [Lysinibacillus sp. 1 U-2021]
MGKNSYSGVEVYVSKLKNGTEFRCRNGEWNAKFIVENSIPKIVTSDGTIRTVSKDYKLNISTNEEIPMEAFVYESVYYAFEFKRESEKLHELYCMVKDVLLTDNELNKIDQSINLCIANLNYLRLKYKGMNPENHY